MPNASPYIAPRGQQAANQMCGLSGYQVPFEQAKWRSLCKNKRNDVSMVDRRLTELKETGSSLPMYRECILADANRGGK